MRMQPTLLLAIGLWLSACGAPGDPSGGTLVVLTSTQGDDPDLDGYELTVDGVSFRHLDPSGRSENDLPAGHHTLELLGAAEQCSVSPGTPLDVEIPSGDTTSVAFEFSCSATGVRITSTTTGLDFDPDNYRVEVDGADRGTLPSNATIMIRLEPGSRTIAPTDLSPNCTIQGSGSATVIIVRGKLAPIEFAFVCTATKGVIGVAVEATGPDVEGEYIALVDGTPFPFQLTDVAYLPLAPVGNHVVSLDPPPNCSLESDPRSLTLTGGGLIRDTVTVNFSVTCRPGSGTIRVTARIITGPVPAGEFHAWACPTQLQYYCDYGNLEKLLGAVEPNDTLIAKVSPGTYNIELRDLPANCRVNAPNPRRGLIVTNGTSLTVGFPLEC
jgi:hypothetical protein